MVQVWGRLCCCARCFVGRKLSALRQALREGAFMWPSLQVWWPGHLQNRPDPRGSSGSRWPCRDREVCSAHSRLAPAAARGLPPAPRILFPLLPASQFPLTQPSKCIFALTWGKGEAVASWCWLGRTERWARHEESLQTRLLEWPYFNPRSPLSGGQNEFQTSF